MNEEKYVEMLEDGTLYDFITNLQDELYSANQVVNELLDVKEENEFLKLNNPEQNMEHFRIVKENKRKIDNLRKENERLEKRNIYYINNEKKLLSDWHQEHNEAIEYKSRNEKAIKCIKDKYYKEEYERKGTFTNKLMNILQGEDK